MKKLFAIALLALVSTAVHAQASEQPDCRIHVNTQFSMTNFGEFDTNAYAIDLSKYLHDKLNYDVSFDQDVPFTLDMKVTGDGATNTLSHSMILSSTDKSMMINLTGSDTGMGRRTRRQTKKVESLLEDLQTSIPHSPCYR